MTNNITRLPDAYDKKSGSNISKVLQLAYELAEAQEKDSNDIDGSRSIENAYGKTLDRYGKMYGVDRGGATDQQYRTIILMQIGKNAVQADSNSIIKAIELAMQSEGVSLHEGDMTVSIEGLSTTAYEESGYTADEVKQLISSLLPVGVSLESVMFDGTLLIFDVTVEGDLNYPQLYSAWYYGQRAYAEGKEVGLSGDGTVPNSFLEYAPEYQTSGTYEGGTLSLRLG